MTILGTMEIPKVFFSVFRGPMASAYRMIDFGEMIVIDHSFGFTVFDGKKICKKLITTSSNLSLTFGYTKIDGKFFALVNDLFPDPFFWRQIDRSLICK